MFASPDPAEKKPTVYLFYGDDGFALQKFVQELLSKISDDPTTVEMNSTRLEGNHCRVDDVRNAAFALPFLANRRMVVLNQVLALTKAKKAQEQFLDLLEKLPDSTALVLVVETVLDRKDWKDFAKTHWLRKWAAAQGPQRVYQKEFSLPNQHMMHKWILDETKRQNGKILPAAALELANHVGTNTQLASLEIDKLLTYVNLTRPVEVEDVKFLVPDVAPLNVFDMVDAMAEGKTSQAIKLLHGLLEEMDSFNLFGMIIRQFRLLLLANEVLERGGRKEEIAEELNVHSFVAGKLESQALRFTSEGLQEVFQQLLIIDENVKTSQMDIRLALDLFVSELSLS